MTYTDLMMKVIDGEKLNPIEREQMRQYVSEIDNNRQIVSSWQQINKKIDERYLDLPIGTIVSKVFESDQASFTVQIPPDYNHMLILSSVKTTHAGYNDGVIGRFNDDDGANYSEGYDGGQASSAVTGQTKVQTFFGVSVATGTSATLGATGSSFVFIPNYNSSNWKSVLRVQGTGEYSATDVLTLMTSAHWRNTSPVRKITVLSENSANLATGSILTILGIK